MSPARRLILILFLTAILARLAVFGLLLYHYGPGSFYLANDRAALSDNDSQNYVTIAKNLTEHGVYSRFASPPHEPDSFRTPLLALYFVPFVHFFGFASGVTFAMLILDIVLAVSAVLAFLVARFFLPDKYAFWAGIAVALEPLLVYRSNIAEPDALVVLLLLAGIYFFIKFWRTAQAKYLYYTAGFLALLTLAKPVGMYLIILFLVFAAAKRTPIRNLIWSALIFVILLFPWMIRNYQVFGVWGISSVTAYNFYTYYTQSLPGEADNPSHQGREPARDLRYAKYYLGVAKDRIQEDPKTYAKGHAVGMLRNFFASDFAGIYNNGHTKILPFFYSPVNEVNLTSLLLAGNYREFGRVIFSPGQFAFLARHVGFALFYLAVIWAWIRSYFTDRQNFWLFSLFIILTLYFVFTTVTFVDAKYRLPAMPLLLIMFFRFWRKS